MALYWAVVKELARDITMALESMKQIKAGWVILEKS